MQDYDEVFPAHAGVIPSLKVTHNVHLCFSRTRGGDPATRWLVQSVRAFFPHTRG